ncbi:MAG: hypothetical protein IJF27_08460 [Oscillospiraceae bacterium]|nr:hypothetical protein [Oscillospiraceae bacterium]MBQ3048831.1 hypothetical protein [Oscillospiraceae bacterium]MBQ9938723.1 hypothetical protein [Oscillospiraceae bacterium]
MMTLTFVSVIIMSLAFIAIIIFTAYFLGHVEMLFGFGGETKETQATVVGFISRGHDEFHNPKTPQPIIEYYNEFTGRNERKELFNSGVVAVKSAVTKNEKSRICIVDDKVLVQYTPKKVRVIDSRIVTPNKFKLARYLIPIAASVTVGIIGCLLLVVSIIAQEVVR